MAYIDLFDIDPASAASISAPLGGGMGRLREVCGAVSGMFMIAGLYYKNDAPADMAKRKQVYTAVQDLAEKSKAYYKRRPCANYVASAARLIGEKLNQEISKD